MEITKNKIKTIGKRLRKIDKKDQISEANLATFTVWRDSHGPSLAYLVQIIEAEIKSLQLKNDNFSITQRLKRFYSIILKLKRFPEMQLSMMDDIAGARVVLTEVTSVFKLFDRLKDKRTQYSILKINNYISNPKDDGYRSIHMVYRVEKELSLQMELQLRSELQHVWATGVEVFGTIVSTSFKTGDGKEQWREFFQMLSSKFALHEGQPVLRKHEVYSNKQLTKMLQKKIKELKVIEKLNAYTTAYKSDWREKRSKGRLGKYALLILDNIKNRTDVEFFAGNKRLAALERYSEIENQNLSSEDINVVLVSVDDMNNLEKAYPNYFMDTKQLTLILSQIILDEF